MIGRARSSPDLRAGRSPRAGQPDPSEWTMGNSTCDLCGDQVPQVDLEEGRAYRRGPRLVCAQCDQAMGGGGALPEVGETQPAAPGANSGAARPRLRRHRQANAGLWAVASLTAVVAGWSLWQVHGSRDEIRRLRADLVEWQSQQERQWTRYQARASADWTDREAALREEWARGDQATLDAASVSQKELGEQLQSLNAELERRAQSDSQATEAWLQQLEAWKAEWPSLEASLLRIEEEGRTRSQTLQEELEDVIARMNELETMAVPAEEPPTGVQAAPWFAITGDLQHEQVAIRLDAVYSLEQSQDVRICPYLRPLLQDPDSLIRLAVARILAEYRFRPATPDLIAGLEDPVLSVRDGFAKALRRITGRQFGFRADARETEREKPLESWRSWWAERGQAFLQGQPG